ncbi:MAG: hypothetical protein IJI92_06770 [Erysipelotrichaceae bacterium]|nr:hypothetical protein [Erysipelotrichaceae bacterium]
MMNRQLMWIYGLLPQEETGIICDICRKQNEDLKLSEHFLDFPLHISLKRSFYTADFENVRDDILKITDRTIECGEIYPYKQKDMIWLRITKEDEIRAVHEELDEYLRDRYQIAIDGFDRTYLPHVSLFHNCDELRKEKMYERLTELLPPLKVKIDRYIIGSKVNSNVIYDRREK